MTERLRLPGIAILTILTCLSIHELGHALAAGLSGGRVLQFTVISLRPHVQVAGVATVLQEEFRCVAGSGLFSVVYLIFLLANSSYGEVGRLTRMVASCHAVAEILGWISSCVWPALDASPDDAAHFLAVSGANRWEVAGVCAAIGVLILLVWRRTQPRRSAGFGVLLAR